MAFSSVPVQRLIFSVGSTSQNIAAALIRNSSAPPPDVQIGDDRSMGFRGLKNSMKKSVSRKDFKQNRDFYEVSSHDAIRAWDRPLFQDFGTSLYYDRLMLGEPPTRTAVAVPEGESATYDSLCRILQQFQTLEPEDILILADGDGRGGSDSGDDNDDASGGIRKVNHRGYQLHLGPLSEHTLVATNRGGVALAAKAIQWRFEKNENSENENDDGEEDENPLQYVSCLVTTNTTKSSPESSSESSSLLSLSTSSPIDEERTNSAAFLSALWCSHPAEAAVAAKLLNAGTFFEKVINGSSNNNQSNHAAENLMDEEEANDQSNQNHHQHHEKQLQRVLSSMFQFSMIRLKKEKLVEAANNPRIARALVPGFPLSGLEQKRDVIAREIERKKEIDEKVRQEGKMLLKKLQSVA